MQEVIKEKIDKFRIKDLGFDMMGYTFDELADLSVHHLLIPRKKCKNIGLGNGIYYWNSAILVRNTAHDYLHLIETTDHDIFDLITSEMIDENVLKRIEIANLKRIRELLLSFEREHDRDVNKKGEYIIKPSFIEKRIQLK